MLLILSPFKISSDKQYKRVNFIITVLILTSSENAKDIQMRTGSSFPDIYKDTDQDDLMVSTQQEGKTAQVKEQSATEIMLVLSIYLFKKEKQETKPRTRAEIFA